MKLFEDKNRTYLQPAAYNEKTFQYYDRSARKDVSIIREVLNSWFDNYPQSEKLELKKRFRKTFSSAFYELFLFYLFKSQGFQIIVHPSIRNKSRRPDFLIIKNKIEIYVEAKLAKDKTDEEESIENRINQFYDSLNKIKSKNFFLYIEDLILKTDKQPSTKFLIKLIENELKKFDPDKITEQINNNSFEERPRLCIENENIVLNISIIPKDLRFRVESSRPLGALPIETFWGGSEESIKLSFSKKVNRYGNLNKPYLICINAIGSKFSGEIDVMNAVWGTEAISWSSDPNNRNEKLTRLKDGLFFSKMGAIHTNASGVLITSVKEFNIPIAKYWLIKHPFSKNDLDFSVFKMTYQQVIKNRITLTEGQSFGSILNIDDEWLK